jgi:hypothetical protein
VTYVASVVTVTVAASWRCEILGAGSGSSQTAVVVEIRIDARVTATVGIDQKSPGGRIAGSAEHVPPAPYARHRKRFCMAAW